MSGSRDLTRLASLFVHGPDIRSGMGTNEEPGVAGHKAILRVFLRSATALALLFVGVAARTFADDLDNRFPLAGVSDPRASVAPAVGGFSDPQAPEYFGAAADSGRWRPEAVYSKTSYQAAPDFETEPPPSVPVDAPSNGWSPESGALFDGLSLFAGLDGSKQPQDLGVNALMGGRMAFNW